ncbi:MAG: hypothetical protein ACJ04O_04315 [Cellvibrionales bacterium]|nr:hypothetical protein [Porticoccaceae bacterium]
MPRIEVSAALVAACFLAVTRPEGVTVNNGANVVGEIRFRVGSDLQRDWGCR